MFECSASILSTTDLVVSTDIDYGQLVKRLVVAHIFFLA